MQRDRDHRFCSRRGLKLKLCGASAWITADSEDTTHQGKASFAGVSRSPSVERSPARTEPIFSTPSLLQKERRTRRQHSQHRNTKPQVPATRLVSSVIDTITSPIAVILLQIELVCLRFALVHAVLQRRAAAGPGSTQSPTSSGGRHSPSQSWQLHLCCPA